MIHTIHFPNSAFKWTHQTDDPDALEHFSLADKPWKRRSRCKTCGCTVASSNSQRQSYSVWGVQLERDEEGKIKYWDVIKPTAHIFYETRILDIKDGLGKWDGYEGTSNRIDHE